MGGQNRIIVVMLGALAALVLIIGGLSAVLLLRGGEDGDGHFQLMVVTVVTDSYR